MRAGARWVLLAYSLPLIVALALVGAEPIWAVGAFLAFAGALAVATVDTSRRIAKRGAARRSLALAVKEILTTLAVLTLVDRKNVVHGKRGSIRVDLGCGPRLK